MNNIELELQLQAFLDDELSESEKQAVASRLAQDREAVALLAELRNTRQTLQGFERSVRLPESGDFYWTKIRRQIEALDPAPAPAPVATPWYLSLRRWLAPVTAVGLVALVGVLITRNAGLLPAEADGQAETSLTDSGAFTYRDYSEGATLVWLSYPADN